MSLVTTCRWAARVLGMCLFLVWGAFFVEHLSWFADPGHLPPLRVIAIVALHLTMLLGFVIALKWELVGGALTILSALAFFSQTAGKHFYPFFFITVVPAVMYLLCWWRTRSL